MSTEEIGEEEVKESESIENKDSCLKEEALETRLTGTLPEELATLPAIITEAIVTTETKEIELDDFEISCRQIILPSSWE